jgi:GTP:adenosylcobinamide-phosphate guanylyltransferase
MEKLPLLLLAGEGDQRIDPLLEHVNKKYRALIEFKGKFVITLLLEKFLESGIISHYVIIGIPKDYVQLPDGLPLDQVDFLETPGQDFTDRLNNAANHLLELAKEKPDIFPKGTTNALYVPADLPLLETESILEYYQKTVDNQFDLYPAVIERKVMEDRYGFTERTYLLLKNANVRAEYSLSDLAVMNMTSIGDVLDNVRSMRKNRKKVLFIILFLKPSILFKFLFKRLSFKDVEGAVNKVFKIKSKIIEMQHPDLAMDIDNVFQYELVKREFEKL